METMIAFVLKLMLPLTPFKIVLKLLFTPKFGVSFDKSMQ